MSADARSALATKIPMTFRRRAGKAVIVLPNGERAIECREALIDNAMVKLIARGHRWHRQLVDGTHASIADIAKSENINPSFVSRTLRLAYLSPTIVEAILKGQFPAHWSMKRLIAPFPMEWELQREHFFAEKPVHPAGAKG